MFKDYNFYDFLLYFVLMCLCVGGVIIMIGLGLQYNKELDKPLNCAELAGRLTLGSMPAKCFNFLKPNEALDIHNPPPANSELFIRPLY